MVEGESGTWADRYCLEPSGARYARGKLPQLVRHRLDDRLHDRDQGGQVLPAATRPRPAQGDPRAGHRHMHAPCAPCTCMHTPCTHLARTLHAPCTHLGRPCMHEEGHQRPPWLAVYTRPSQTCRSSSCCCWSSSSASSLWPPTSSAPRSCRTGTSATRSARYSSFRTSTPTLHPTSTPTPIP